VTDDEEIVRQLREEWGPAAAASLERLQPDLEVKEAILRRILRTPRQGGVTRTWRIAATVALGLVLLAVGLLVGSDDPAPDCSALLRQAEYTSDVAVELEARCAGLDPTARP
jgi:hypothetical protein